MGMVGMMCRRVGRVRATARRHWRHWMSVHMTGEEWRQTMAGENGTAGDASGGGTTRVELDLIRPVTLIEIAHVIVHDWVALKGELLK